MQENFPLRFESGSASIARRVAALSVVHGCSTNACVLRQHTLIYHETGQIILHMLRKYTVRVKLDQGLGFITKFSM